MGLKCETFVIFSARAAYDAQRRPPTYRGARPLPAGAEGVDQAGESVATAQKPEAAGGRRPSPTQGEERRGGALRLPGADLAKRRRVVAASCRPRGRGPLDQRRRDGVLDGNAQQRPPAARPGERRRGPEQARRAAGAEGHQLTHEGARPAPPAAADLASEHDQLVRAGAAELSRRLRRVARRRQTPAEVSARGCASPLRRTGDTKVVSQH